jgi:TolB-like protein
MSAPGSGQREGRDRRRLAAIVSVDVVGYSRLMGRDESGTLAALKAHRRELIDPKIAEHHGRIVKTTGDGLLLEYSSVVDAVRCSGDIQRGIAAWSLPSLLRTAPAPAQPPLSVAVLPFTAPGGAAADEQFADALTQDVTTALAQWRWATVASGRKVTSQKGKDSDARSVGRDLNVRYLVEAELRRAGNKLAITVRLIDAESATNAWSERLEFDAVRPLDEPSAPATRISRRLQQSIYEAEMQRAAARPVPGSAWDLVLRGDVALSAGDDPLTNAVAARKWYDEALRIDPRFVPALVSVAVADNELLSNDLDLDRARFAQAVEEMDKLTARAVSVDVNDSAAWFVRAAALTWLNRWDEALAANEKGQALDPSNAIFVSNQAYITLVVAGPDQALVLAKRASSNGSRHDVRGGFFDPDDMPYQPAARALWRRGPRLRGSRCTRELVGGPRGAGRRIRPARRPGQGIPRQGGIAQATTPLHHRQIQGFGACLQGAALFAAGRGSPLYRAAQSGTGR